MPEDKQDLEERTYLFAEDCRQFIRTLPRTLSNNEDSKQLIRSSGSVAANWIEAAEALSDKDFIYRLKVSRKEARESQLWLKLLNPDGKEDVEQKRQALIQEAEELKRILSSIIIKKEKD